MKIKKYLKLLVLPFTALLIPLKTLAVCPVCTLAVIGGVELSRWLGVDDTISGIWIGALIVSLSLWTINWLRKKNIRFLFRKIIVFIFYYAITILTLYWKKMVFYPNCSKIWGYDKLIVGIVFGSIAFTIGFLLNEWLKKKNNGKVYFPYQRVVVPIVLLLIASLIFHFITKCDPLQKFGL